MKIENCHAVRGNFFTQVLRINSQFSILNSQFSIIICTFAAHLAKGDENQGGN